MMRPTYRIELGSRSGMGAVQRVRLEHRIARQRLVGVGRIRRQLALVAHVSARLERRSGILVRVVHYVQVAHLVRAGGPYQTVET